MKKFIFGCVLMLCGVIGGTGWAIAYGNTDYGSQAGLRGLFEISDQAAGAAGEFVFVFYLIAVVGLIFAIVSMAEKK